MQDPRIELKPGADIALEQMLALYSSVGWTAYTEGPAARVFARPLKTRPMWCLPGRETGWWGLLAV